LPNYINNSIGYSFKAKIYKFYAKDLGNRIAVDFSMSNLLRDDFKHPNVTFKKAFSKIYLITLSGRDNLVINQFGNVPFGSWNPRENSNISINNLSDYLELTDTFKTTWPKESIEKGKKIIDYPESTYPVLDLIGKPIIIWAHASFNVFVNNEPIFESDWSDEDVNQARHNDEYIAIVVEPPFSARIVAFPPMNNESENTSNNSREFEFQLILNIAKDDNIEKTFSSAKKLVKDNKITVSSDIYALRDHLQQQIFSYPDLPEKWGLSLYGEIPELEMKSVKGSLIIGTSNIVIGAPATLKLTGIKNISTKYGSLSMMPNGVTDFMANVKEIYLNGQLIYTNWDKYSREITFIALVLGILGIIPIYKRFK